MWQPPKTPPIIKGLKKIGGPGTGYMRPEWSGLGVAPSGLSSMRARKEIKHHEVEPLAKVLTDEIDKIDPKANATIKTAIQKIEARNKSAMSRIGKVYDFILQETADRLDALNKAIVDVNQASKAKAKAKRAAATKYQAARNKWLEFYHGVQCPSHPSFVKFSGPTLDWVSIEPIVAGGIVVGASVAVHWLGGTHSSSSGVAIPH